jgi:hypothetical protein
MSRAAAAYNWLNASSLPAIAYSINFKFFLLFKNPSEKLSGSRSNISPYTVFNYSINSVCAAKSLPSKTSCHSSNLPDAASTALLYLDKDFAAY